jgi:hypothetical protein
VEEKVKQEISVKEIACRGLIDQMTDFFISTDEGTSNTTILILNLKYHRI